MTSNNNNELEEQTNSMIYVKENTIYKFTCCTCGNMENKDKLIINDKLIICIYCYFNIKYKNKEDFDNLINNDKITIYEYINKYLEKHNLNNCNTIPCLLCDVKNNIVVRNLKRGKKIYGNIYKNIGNRQLLYEESLKLENLL
jgi:hypothetical protein